jgi:hypothetical protein
VGNALRDTTVLTLRTEKDSATPQMMGTKQRRKGGSSPSSFFRSTMSSLQQSTSKLAGTGAVPNKNNHASHHHHHRHHDPQDKRWLQTSIMNDDDHHPSRFQCFSRNGLHDNHNNTNNKNDVREPPSYAVVPIATTTTTKNLGSSIVEILDMFDSDTTFRGQLLDLEPRPLKMSQWHS